MSLKDDEAFRADLREFLFSHKMVELRGKRAARVVKQVMPGLRMNMAGRVVAVCKCGTVSITSEDKVAGVKAEHLRSKKLPEPAPPANWIEMKLAELGV